MDFPPPRAYLATAQTLDDEMVERIRRHQEERGQAFQTFEEPLALARLSSKKFADNCSILIIDCLTLWVSNLLGHGQEQPADPGQGNSDDFLELLKGYPNPGDSSIGNEVGWGIVPE